MPFRRSDILRWRMMILRYTFKQLLEAQNKRNGEYNDEIVKSVVEELFAELEKYAVTNFPTMKRFYCDFILAGDSYVPMYQLTLLERKKILEAFKEQGFKSVSFKTISNDEFPEETASKVYFVCEWE